MAESNAKKILDILSGSKTSEISTATKKKNTETVLLGKMYNFLVKDHKEKTKQKKEIKRIEKEYEDHQTFTPTTVGVSDIPSAKKDTTEQKEKMFGGLGLLGIVAAGVGVYVFSDDIKKQIDDIKQYFEETTWSDAFEKFKSLFDFSDLIDELGLGPVAETVEAGAEISGFDKSQLNILTQGGKTLLSEEEFKQIQSQHKELEGKSFTDVSANIAAQGFKAQEIQQQLGTTDIAQTFAAEKFGVEPTKKLYAAPEKAIAAETVPELAQFQRKLFYKDTGEARTVGEVRELISSQARPPARARELSSMKGAVNRKQVYDYIRSKGVDHIHTMGMMANIEGESGFRPGVIGDNGTSGGLFQWHDTRFANLQRAVPDWQTNWKAQVDYALQDKEGNVQEYLKTPYGTAEDATTGWVDLFERPANPYAASKLRRGFIPAIEKQISEDVSQGGLYSTQVSPVPPLQMTESGSNISGLEFAPGVDPSISDAISGRMRMVQNIFGKKLTITSGFRDADRNSKVGGAKNSAHLRGNAVDVSTNGMSTEDKVRLIQIASAVGIGGIGVYSSGGIHFDVEGRRAWGDDYHLASLPQWAASVITGHLKGSYLGSVQNIQPIEQSITPPIRNIPTPERKPTSGVNSTIIVQQNQVNVSNKTTQKNIDRGFGDMSPQDIINAGIRGY